MGKAARRRSARERLAEERRRSEQRSRRLRAGLTTGGALIMTAVLVIAVVVAQSGKDRPAGYHGGLAPMTRRADGSVAMGKPGVHAPLVEVFEDFQCPACRTFETVNGPTMKRLAYEGAATVVFRPFNLFKQEPMLGNSLRAANAALCAPAGAWVPYHDLLFHNQPQEGTTGFRDTDLIAWAGRTGITGTGFADCVSGRRRVTQVGEMTRYAQQTAGITQTPTVRLNGRDLGQDAAFTVKGFEKAVRAAAPAS